MGDDPVPVDGQGIPRCVEGDDYCGIEQWADEMRLALEASTLAARDAIERAERGHMNMNVGPYELYLSDEIIPDDPVDRTREGWELRLYAWKSKLVDAYRAEDAWGVIVERPDCDYQLFEKGSVAGGYGSRAWLILHRDREATDG